eukprot:COSAG02_NODE_1207_length_13885_cov_124.791237_3_plen_67_part_00
MRVYVCVVVVVVVVRRGGGGGGEVRARERRHLLFNPLASDGSICDADRDVDAQVGQLLCEVPATTS